MKLGLVMLVIWAVLIVGYVMNIYKLATCDFEAPYKAEVIHTIGLVTGLGAFTGYLNVGK